MINNEQGIDNKVSKLEEEKQKLIDENEKRLVIDIINRFGNNDIDEIQLDNLIEANQKDTKNVTYYLKQISGSLNEHGKETIYVGVPKEKAKLDPTGVGDNFRSGFIAGLSWGLNHERCGQLGSMLATYCIETTGTQEYKFTKDEFLTRFETAYGKAATDEIKPHLNVKLVG